MLGPEASAALRDRLIVDVGNLASADDAALWAHRSLPEKNKLAAGDALLVEEAFEAQLAHFPVTATTPAGGVQRKRAMPRNSKVARNVAHPGPIDKSVLTLSEPRRIRDRDHVKFVATRPCLICGRQPSDARFAQSRALGKKVSDEFTVPMCRGHHREVHRSGDEAAWWQKVRIDPTICRSHPVAGHPPAAQTTPGGCQKRTRNCQKRFEL